jgi:hypothetical protein
MLRMRNLRTFRELVSEVKPNKWMDEKKRLKFYLFIIRYRYRLLLGIDKYNINIIYYIFII